MEDSSTYSTNILHSLTRKICCGCSVPDKLDKNLVLIKDWLYHRTSLQDSERELIIFRYSRLIKRIRNRYKYYGSCYTFASLFTSIMALVVTALISLNKFENEYYSQITWWFSWILSLAISVVNTLSTFLKWDRKYILLLQIYNKVEQEIWMFLGLIGPYADINEEEQGTHSSKLRIFLARVELANKRLNDNLLDIEESDQDDRELLKERKHHINNDCSPEFENNEQSIHGLLKTKQQQDRLNAGLSIVGGEQLNVVSEIDEDIVEVEMEEKKNAKNS